jgi:MtrB/PioB family decaheme-associated outer membrane protein
MKKPKQQFSKSLLTLSVLMAVGCAYAEDDVDALTKPESSVSFGAIGGTGNAKSRSIFNQYSGLRKENANVLLDANIINLSEETGLWTKFEGRNLGLDNRDFSFSQNKQGDWKYGIEYSEITHHEMRTISTGITGAGTTTPVVNSANPLADLNLQLRRKGTTVSGEKWLSPNLLAELSFKNEDKQGARLSGAGIFCGSSSTVITTRYTCAGSLTGALLMLPEPVNTNTKQIDAKLNFSGDQFLLSAGYYGSYFANSNSSLNPTVTGNLYSPDGASSFSSGNLLSYLQAPTALAPSNQSQQLYVSGNYAFTPTTHSTFKYAYTRAAQRQDYSAFGIPANASANLSGVMDTTLAQIGLIAKPMPKLKLVANVRYEDKNDKTPDASYNMLAPANGVGTGTLYSNNYSNSSTRLNGKFEGSYQLPDNYRALLGVDYAGVKRAAPPPVPFGSNGVLINPPVSPAGFDLGLAVGGLRQDTRETAYRAELQRVLSDQLNGSVSLVHSERNGGSWTYYNNVSTPATGTNLHTDGTLPMLMLDRIRNKVRLVADWTVSNDLSIQFNAEDGKDSYNAPLGAGMRDSDMHSYGIDAALSMSESWKFTGYANHSEQKLNVNHTSAYLAELANSNTSVSLGVVGRISEQLGVGGSVMFMSDSNHYLQSRTDGAALDAVLPDVTYRSTTLKLYSKYAVQKMADVRVDLMHQRSMLSEWTWSNFSYSDKTTVSMQPNQSMTFLGASYVYKFR